MTRQGWAKVAKITAALVVMAALGVLMVLA